MLIKSRVLDQHNVESKLSIHGFMLKLEIFKLIKNFVIMCGYKIVSSS